MRFLVCVDGSMSSKTALDRALALTRLERNDELFVLAVFEPIAAHMYTVLDGETYEQYVHELNAHARQTVQLVLASATRAAEAKKVPVKTMLVDGKPSVVIPEKCKELKIDLVLAGRRNSVMPIERLATGSTSLHLVRACGVAVIVCKGNEEAEHYEPHHWMVAVDGSTGSTNALELTLRVVRPIDKLTLVCAYSKDKDGATTKLIAAEKLCEQAKVAKVAAVALHGDDARSDLCHYAEDHNVDILMVGTRGHGLLKRLFLGSVSRYLVEHCTVDVGVVR